MAKLSASELKAIRDFLTQRGVTYPPLREEMLDHISCDIEQQMDEGHSYEVASQKILHAIPYKQLQTIQVHTMEAVSKNYPLSKMFAYVSFFLLFAGFFFKIFHYQGAAELLIGSVASITLALISGAVSGMYYHRERKGVWLLLSILFAIILFLNSLTFQILHLPGGTELRTVAVLSLGILFPVSFFYLRTNSGQILPYLHEKYSPGIVRFIMIFFGVTCIMRITLLLTGNNDLVSRVLLVIVIAAAGLHFFAIQWHWTKDEAKKPSVWLTTALAIGFLCFVLPALAGILSPALRTALVIGFFLLGGILVASYRTERWLKVATPLSVAVAIAAQLAWAFSSQGLLKFGAFHSLVVVALVASLVVHRKNSLMSMYLVAALAHYLFVYPWQLAY
jgi:hypothetical protein